ncbi:unnamed protein product, partial [Rotaria sp. Silwood1]
MIATLVMSNLRYFAVPSSTTPTSTGQTSTASEAITTTLICPLTE